MIMSSSIFLYTYAIPQVKHKTVLYRLQKSFPNHGLYPISVEKATLSKPCHDREECFHAPESGGVPASPKGGRERLCRNFSSLFRTVMAAIRK